ncbi:hypothetical protein BJY04DRAFT_220061 [Aspergillus karnatakaensis]|uniref:putative class V chitinase n=1 Tax=Aspergillus karnatakaensis TaxID=1810916 RepID=UPI003CCDF2A6
MALYTPVNGSDNHVTFRACKAVQADTTQDIEFSVTPFMSGLPERRSVALASNTGCIIDDQDVTSNTTDIRFVSGKPSGSGGGSETEGNSGSKNIVSAATAVLEHMISLTSGCSRPTVLFANSGKAVVGLYIGREVHKPSAAKVVRTFIEAIHTSPPDQVAAAQKCGDDGGDYPNTWVMGIYADPHGDIASAQEAVRSWNDARCVSGFENEEVWKDTELNLLKAVQIPQVKALESGLQQSGSTEEQLQEGPDLHRRAECRAIQAAKNDGCISLAQRCGISRTQLANYNKNVENFCDTLQADQWICCSAGDLPDFSPKPNPDGSCATYTISPAEICYDIAETYYLTPKKIEDLNKNTWGWAGCGDLQPGQRICLSTGDPPMPAAISNAVCGPQKPGTLRPTDGTELTDLNPCPLNVCCNIWGQCGLTPDFCVENKADTGAPGTSKPGANGCISNCGMEVVKSDPPSSFSRVAYFEAWNRDRKCLHMDVTDIDTDWFTHIHFAFGDITPDFKVDVAPVQEQFDKLKAMEGGSIKRILSFGGWAFSVERPTYTIFREGVTPENRLNFANNVVSFINEHGLEGVDFDWEYPAAPDLPDIPPGIIEEGKNYLEFLKLVKRRLPNKSVSIAAPASYWYLKGYPIEEIGKVVDYIIYMTYDLHGQWDYGNKWSSEGCPEGNCLRSHVNSTETYNALAMVTKAGVPSRKVFCGIASYGRSFKMAKSGCTGPLCKFTGTNKESDAAKGVCTDEAGYIASAEIREIMEFGVDSEYTNITTETWHDEGSNSDILVYNGLEWVAWMSDATKLSRSDWYQELGFGGTSDWAVDLDRYGGAGGVPGADEESDYGDDTPFEACDEEIWYNTLEEVRRDLENIPARCRNVYISEVLQKMLDAALVKYHDVNNGYDDKFNTYARYMKKAAPKSLDTFMHWITGPGQEYFDCDLVDRFGNSNPYDGRCPIPYPRDELETGFYELEYTLRDEGGFYTELLNETGLDEDAIEFGDKTHETPCDIGWNRPCHPYEVDITNCPLVRKDFEPPNPKDIVETALDDVAELESELISTSLEMAIGSWEGDDDDVIQVLSMPIFMIIQAVEAMAEAKEIGEELEEEEQERLILGIISAVLFFLPFGGVAAAAVNMGRLARIISMASLAGEAGLAMVDIINDPLMAPLVILDMLSKRNLRTPNDYRDAANSRRQMSSEGLGKLGDVFKRHDDVLQDILKTCAR